MDETDFRAIKSLANLEGRLFEMNGQTAREKLSVLRGLGHILVKTDGLPPEKAELVRGAAREMYGEDGELEIDSNAQLSCGGGDQGCYVQAWVWVPYEDVEGMEEFCKEDDE